MAAPSKGRDLASQPRLTKTARRLEPAVLGCCLRVVDFAVAQSQVLPAWLALWIHLGRVHRASRPPADPTGRLFRPRRGRSGSGEHGAEPYGLRPVWGRPKDACAPGQHGILRALNPRSWALGGNHPIGDEFASHGVSNGHHHLDRGGHSIYSSYHDIHHGHPSDRLWP